MIPSVSNAAQLWFPNLAAEVRSRKNKEPVPESKGNGGQDLGPPEDQLGGGWYVRASDRTIRYRPSGHADPLMREWLDATVHTLKNSKLDAVRNMLLLLANPTASGNANSQEPVASGRCLLCHTVDREPDSQELRINWYAKRAGQHDSRLTTFSHTPHMQLPTEKGCVSCHTLDKDSKGSTFRNAFLVRDSDTSNWVPNTQWHQSLTSGFVGLSKSHCATCHTKSSAGDSCLKCHNYHAHSATGRVTRFWRDASSLDHFSGQEKDNEDRSR